MEARIKVGIRIRPLSSKESQEGNSSIPDTLWTDNAGRISIGSDNKNRQNFSYDWTYATTTNSQQVYQEMCSPLVAKVFEGYNATFFAYGQTGSGKTFTMGTSGDFTTGIIPLAVQDIFDRKKCLQQQGAQVGIDLSYMEIYMEECFDLLTPTGEKKKVEVRETSHGETFVEGLTALPVHNMQDVSNYISTASKIRSTGKTAMNSHSSRSHALCTLSIRILNEESSLIAKLNMVDLAGSERAKKTMATGDAFQEGVSINKGLLALGNVVSALSSKSKRDEKSKAPNTATHIHVPYRESKLTRLLKDSLGGNGMTALLACVSPAFSNYDETLNTLRFASRASSIVNAAKVNHEQQTDANVLLKEVHRLREQLTALQSKYEESQARANIDANKMAINEGLPHTNSLNTSSNSAVVIKKDNQSMDWANYLMATQKLTDSLKSLLMQCFAEDFLIEDEFLIKLKDDLSAISGYFEINFSKSSDNDFIFDLENDSDEADIGCNFADLMDGFPSIMTSIDQLKQLDQYFRVQLFKYSNTGRSSLLSDRKSVEDSFMSEISKGQESEIDILPDQSMDSNEDFDSRNLPEPAPNCDASSRPMEDISCASDDLNIIDNSKDHEECKVEVMVIESKLSDLNSLGNKYQGIIGRLHQEIESLQVENARLFELQGNEEVKAKEENTVPGLIRTELKQKSKLLEEKMNTLRKKEMEYAKICMAKDNLLKELQQKQLQIEQFKKNKVLLMKKMREKDVLHREEAKLLMKNEIQSKKRANKAEIHLQKVEKQYSSREKVLLTKLETKEKEKDWLKELLRKKEEVAKMRTIQRAKEGKTGAGFNGNKTSADYKRMLVEELERETEKGAIKGRLQHLLEVRRRMQQKKITIKQSMRRLRQSSQQHKELGSRLQTLEDGIKARTKEIIALQMAIGSSSAEASFAPLAFANTDNPAELKQCIKLLWMNHCELLQNKNKLATEVEEWQSKYPVEEEFESGDDDEEGSESEENNDDEDAAEADGSGALDETFYPSEDEDEVASQNSSNDSDDSYAPRRSKKRQRARGGVGAKKRVSNQFEQDSSDISIEKEKGGKKRKVNIVASKSSDPMDENDVAKWSSYTVKDLKSFLMERGLPVSGVKNELIRRLIEFETANKNDSDADLEADKSDNSALSVAESSFENESSSDNILENSHAMDDSTISEIIPPTKTKKNYQLELSELTDNNENVSSAFNMADDGQLLSPGNIDKMEQDIQEKRRRLLQSAQKVGQLEWFDDTAL